MFGFRRHGSADGLSGPRVSTRICTDRFGGKYPHVGLYDVPARKVWVCRALAGQAIRTAHAALITGEGNATGTVWKDRFLCFWFYTPGTGEGYVHGYPIEWDEAHLLVRIDPHWDYDRQRLIPAELDEQVSANIDRQIRHGRHILDFYVSARLKYPVSLHYIGQRATDSIFYARRIEPAR